MPKTYSQTKKGRANELLKRLERGPDFRTMYGEPLTAQDASRRYRLWAEVWVLDELRDLVPELRYKAKQSD